MAGRIGAGLGSGQGGPGGEPPHMSEAEKRMAEWEARHDVAARGHRAGPDVLQHYFAHERLSHDEGVRPPRKHPAPAPARPSEVPRVDGEQPSRGLWRRLFRRRS